MSDPSFEVRDSCRACGGEWLRPVCSFGSTPLSDKLTDRPDSVVPAPRLPLDLVWCEACRLTQLSIDVDPDFLFSADYPYYSSVSPALVEHFAASAAHLTDAYEIGAGSVVIEAASNDGCLLRHFADVGARAIGFDPAAGPAAVAAALGIDARVEFFGAEVARSLVESGIRADLFLANNVLAHVADLRGFVRGIASVLQPTGTAVIEVPYFVRLVDGREFDTIYHQHLCYFLVGNLSALFASFGLCIAGVEQIPIHGGSLRLFVRHGDSNGECVETMIEAERAAGHDAFEYAEQVGIGALHVRDRLNALVDDELAAGRRLRAYGAAGKATTQLAVCGLDADRLTSVADLNRHKHGRFMPGTDLRIVSREEMLADEPDTVLILAWNLADEIMRQLRDEAGFSGRFLIPSPEPRLV